MDAVWEKIAAVVPPVIAHSAIYNFIGPCGVRFCYPQRSVGSTPVHFHTPIWNVSTFSPEKQSIPASPINIPVTVQHVIHGVIYRAPVFVQYSVMTTGVSTAHCPIVTDAVHAWRAIGVSTTEQDRLWRGDRSGAGWTLHADERAWGVLANLSWCAGRVPEGALINIYTAPLCWPVVTLATARGVAAELCVVAGETITNEAIFTDTSEALAGKGVSSFLWLQTVGVVIAWITVEDKGPCEDRR